MIGILLAAVLQTTVPMRSLDKGPMSQVDSARQAVARSAAEWSTLWSQHAGDRARPAVDFSKEMVVAVFLGTRPTAGFSVEVVGARQEGATLIVSYRESRPQPGAVAAQVLTSPFHFVAVPKHDDVKWERVS
jgi:protease stability complex PrcB-like protein